MDKTQTDLIPDFDIAPISGGLSAGARAVCRMIDDYLRSAAEANPPIGVQELHISIEQHRKLMVALQAHLENIDNPPEPGTAISYNGIPLFCHAVTPYRAKT